MALRAYADEMAAALPTWLRPVPGARRPAAVAAVCAAAGGQLERAEAVALEIVRTRWVRHADADDLVRLGRLLGVRREALARDGGVLGEDVLPESVEAFRERIQETGRALVAGLSTVEGLARVAALRLDQRVVAWTPWWATARPWRRRISRARLAPLDPQAVVRLAAPGERPPSEALQGELLLEECPLGEEQRRSVDQPAVEAQVPGGLPAPVEVRLTAREALDEPVVRLARAGLLLRLGLDLAPGDTAVLPPDALLGDGPSSGRLERPGEAPRALPVTLVEEPGREPPADRTLRLLPGQDEVRLLSLPGPQFDQQRFDRDRFAPGGALEAAVFGVSRFDQEPAVRPVFPTTGGSARRAAARGCRLELRWRLPRAGVVRLGLGPGVAWPPTSRSGLARFDRSHFDWALQRLRHGLGALNPGPWEARAAGVHLEPHRITEEESPWTA